MDKKPSLAIIQIGNVEVHIDASTGEVSETPLMKHN